MLLLIFQENRRKSVLLGAAGSGLNAAKAFAFPILSCLNKDASLSHALTVPLGAALPFPIGRDSTNFGSSSAGAGAGEGAEAPNDFVVNGMGITAR